MANSIRTKILIPILLSIFLVFALLLFVITGQNKKDVQLEFEEFSKYSIDRIYDLVEQYDQLIETNRELKMHEIRSMLSGLVETAVSAVNVYYEQYRSGRITEAQAKAQALNALRSLRYGKEGYFWADTTEYELLVLPPDPAQEGRNRRDVQDLNGKFMIREMVDGAKRNNESYVEYYFRKLGDANPSPKLGHTRIFKPWGWVIGTGVYFDSVEKELEDLRKIGLENLNKSLYSSILRGSYPFIKDRENKYIAYIDQTKLGQKVPSKDMVTGEDLTSKYFAIKNGKVEYYFSKSTVDPKKPFKKTGYVRHHEKLDWIIVYSLYEDDILVNVRKTGMFILIAGTLSMIILGILIFSVLNLITKPLNTAALSLKNIAEGEADLTSKLKIHSHDEIGLLSRHFNSFTEKLHGIVFSLRRIGTESREIGIQLAENSTEISSTVTEIAATMESIEAQSASLDTAVGQTRGSVQDIQQNIGEITKKIESQAAFISESSSAIEEMIASIKNIAQTTQEKQLVVNTLSASAEAGSKELINLVASIKETDSSAKAIRDMIGIINDISERINLLSMNAAIEAAHAGEQGKGFAVVASEIRKLAEATRKNAAEISSFLGKVVEQSGRASSITDSTRKTIENMLQEIPQVSQAMSEMTYALQEISAGSDQVTRALTELVDVSSVISESSITINDKASVAMKSTTEIEGLSEQTHKGITEIALGVSGISKAITELNSQGMKNSEHLEDLEREIGKFKV